MKKWLYSLLLWTLTLCSGVLHASDSEVLYNLSISAIFQNEAPYLREWIEYHEMLGVDHFWLYNNQSSDDYQEVLLPYIDRGLVELIEWPTTPFPSFHLCQVGAYNDSMARGLETSRWVTCIDIDEFIVPISTDNIPDFLVNYEDVAGVSINWQVYGTSYLAAIPEGKTLIESLILKAPVEHKENRFVKLIVQPRYIEKFFLHSARSYPQYNIVAPNGNKRRRPTIQIDAIRINHYWTRAEDFFFGVKLARGSRIRYTTYTDKKIADILRTYNSLEDRTIERFVPELRLRLQLD
jgi:hypothetical protein